MDPTTLVTFLFRAPPEARTVELLGSWDNFYQPYRMHNDRRRGAGFWSGCFKFHNIIFDGDKSQWTKPRTGGLKQGGTYWYYYRLDDDIEAYDDSKEYTTSCPLLPGQTLNVIEVPMEVEQPCRSRSASFDVVGTLAKLPSTHTLDPGAKFNALDPPPISKVHNRCLSDLALNGRLENPAQPAEESSDLRPLSRRSDTPPTSSRSYHSEFEVGPLQSSGRFYAQGAHIDERGSINSRRSWRSAASNYSHSSVVDLYGVDSPVVEEAAESESLARSLRGKSPGSETDVAVDQGEHLESLSYLPPPDRAPPSPPHPPESRASEDDTDGFDLCSPTYSAATISSNGGLNTPYRLSASHPSIGHADPFDNSIEHVAERLRSLSSTDYETNLPSPILEEVDESAKLFTGYSLPTTAAQSAQSLDHLSSGKTSITTILPTIVVPDEDQQPSSLADSIFSELRFSDLSVA